MRFSLFERGILANSTTEEETSGSGLCQKSIPLPSRDLAHLAIAKTVGGRQSPNSLTIDMAVQNRFLASRQTNLRKLLKSSDAQAILVTNIVNVGYLSGFTGSAGYLLVTDKKFILMSDARYTSQIQEECPGIETEIRTADSTMLDSVAKVARSLKINSMAVEAGSLTKATYDQIQQMLTTVNLVDTSGWIAGLRSIKDKSEIETIRKSIAVNQRAFQVIRSQLTAEQTELQIAHNLEHQMRAFGAKCCSFDPIVGVGPRGALPHGKPSDKNIGESDFVLIDWGAQVDRYASDLTRVLVTSRKIPTKLRKIYNTVLKAQVAAIKKIRPGVTVKAVDAAARKVIENAGFGKQFGHGTGHSFGLEIHETPFMSPIHEGKLEANMVVTVEPGIYIEGWGGVRIEDDILVTRDGHEVLSDLPKQLEECQVNLG